MPHLPQVYSLTTVGPWIVPAVTEACKQCDDGLAGMETVTGVATWAPVQLGQIV